MKQWIGYIIGLVAIIVLIGMMYSYFYTPPTTVILVRHAERLNDTDTTSLSPEGRERATELAHTVRDAGVASVFVTEKARTQQTAMPAATLLSLTPVVIPADSTGRLLDSLRTHQGQTVLVVGHGNTLGAILTGLGVHEPVTIARSVYDDMFVVVVSPSRASLVSLKYGKPS